MTKTQIKNKSNKSKPNLIIEFNTRTYSYLTIYMFGPWTYHLRQWLKSIGFKWKDVDLFVKGWVFESPWLEEIIKHVDNELYSKIQSEWREGYVFRYVWVQYGADVIKKFVEKVIEELKKSGISISRIEIEVEFSPKTLHPELPDYPGVVGPKQKLSSFDELNKIDFYNVRVVGVLIW